MRSPGVDWVVSLGTGAITASAFDKGGTQQRCGQGDLYEGKSTKSLRLVSVATLYLDLMNKHWVVG